MTKWLQPFSWRSVCVAVLCVSFARGSHAAEIRRPSEDDLIRLTGEQLARGVGSMRWEVGNPPQSNLVIYSVEPRKYDSNRLTAIANHFGVKGEIQPIPPSFLPAPGYWVKQPNPTNHPWFKAVSFSEKSGRYSFAGDEDDHKWDLKNHKPLVRGVPTPEEALARTLHLLPLFGISTNDLEHTPNGRLRWSYTTEGTTYKDRADGQRKRYIRRINLMLWQRVHEWASTLSIGGGGMFEASYISEGKLAEVQFLFRKMKPVAKAKSMTREEVLKSLKSGNARSFQPSPETTLIVTNCTLVYPQHNGDHRQDFMWPFYEVRGCSIRDGETNSHSIYVPLKW